MSNRFAKPRDAIVVPQSVDLPTFYLPLSTCPFLSAFDTCENWPEEPVS